MKKESEPQKRKRREHKNQMAEKVLKQAESIGLTPQKLKDLARNNEILTAVKGFITNDDQGMIPIDVVATLYFITGINPGEFLYKGNEKDWFEKVAKRKTSKLPKDEKKYFTNDYWRELSRFFAKRSFHNGLIQHLTIENHDGSINTQLLNAYKQITDQYISKAKTVEVYETLSKGDGSCLENFDAYYKAQKIILNEIARKLKEEDDFEYVRTFSLDRSELLHPKNITTPEKINRAFVIEASALTLKHIQKCRNIETKKGTRRSIFEICEAKWMRNFLLIDNEILIIEDYVYTSRLLVPDSIIVLDVGRNSIARGYVGYLRKEVKRERRYSVSRDLEDFINQAISYFDGQKAKRQKTLDWVRAILSLLENNNSKIPAEFALLQKDDECIQGFKELRGRMYKMKRQMNDLTKVLEDKRREIKN